MLELLDVGFVVVDGEPVLAVFDHALYEYAHRAGRAYRVDGNEPRVAELAVEVFRGETRRLERGREPARKA